MFLVVVSWSAVQLVLHAGGGFITRLTGLSHGPLCGLATITSTARTAQGSEASGERGEEGSEENFEHS